HLDALREKGAEDAADRHAECDPEVAERGCAELREQRERRQHGDRHADHAEGVAAPRGGRVRQSLERLDEADRGDEVEQDDRVQAQRHFAAPARAFGSFLRNISSMRRVTRKPPKTLTEASATAATPMNLPSVVSVSAAASIAPTMTIAEIAFVTAISGVCSAGVTFQTTW